MVRHDQAATLYVYPVMDTSSHTADQLSTVDFAGERWTAVDLSEGEAGSLLFRFLDDPKPLFAGGIYRLRLTLAKGMGAQAIIRVVDAATMRTITRFDMRHGYGMQIFEAPLAADDVSHLWAHGCALILEEGSPVSIIVDRQEKDSNGPSPFCVHLLTGACTLISAPVLPMFIHQLLRETSFHPSGWMIGCVLDGLHDWYEAIGDPRLLAGVKRHMQSYEIHEAARTGKSEGPMVVDGKIVGDRIERSLPVAVLAKLDPEHEQITHTIAFWQAFRQEDQAIFDKETRTISTEGSYTVAYPMAVIAAQRGDRELATLACAQLLSRQAQLVADDGLFLRRHMDTGATSYRNWSRGCAWYLLGLARSLPLLQGLVSDEQWEAACTAFRQIAAHAAKYQDYSGLWPNFWDRPTSGWEASGSAGIAAALAMGAKAGLLDVAYRMRAEKTWLVLQHYLTPDGLMNGVAQTNQGGEALQMSGYRTLFPMAMGLMAQLGAALGKWDPQWLSEQAGRASS